MIFNDTGKIIKKLQCDITNDFPKIRLHEFVVMPNHIHGIIEIPVGADSISARTSDSISVHYNINLRKLGEIDSPPTGVDLPKIIQSFKRHTTIEYIKMVKKILYRHLINGFGNTTIMIILYEMKNSM